MWRSWLARAVWDRKVEGSSPFTPTIFIFMNPEINQPEESEKSHKIRKGITVVLIGGLSIAAWQLFDKSGDVEKIEPIHPKQQEIDETHRQLSWNMHNEAAKRWRQINTLIQEKDLDVAVLQEVSRKDFKKLASRLPDFYVTYAMADAKSKPDEGGYGNLIISKQKPRDVKGLSLTGSKFLSGVVHTVTGLTQDAAYANTKLSQTGKGFQADRSALAMTLSVRRGEELEDVRVITSHIAGDERVHDEQFSDLLDFVRKETAPNRPTVFCGDLNSTPENVIPNFAELGFITPETGGTWTGPSNRTIDYCAYKPNEVFGLGKVAILPEKTDHYALLGTWTTR